MSEEQARALAIATIHQNLDTGMWFVRGSGNGLVREVWLESPLYAERIISSLVANGYEVEDPEHYCDLFDLFDEPMGAEPMDYETAELTRSNRGPVVTAELAGAFTPRCDF